MGATLRFGARASHCSGFSCCGARALGAQASVLVARGLSSYGLWALGVRASVVVACRLSSCGTRALDHRLSSCGTQALLLHGMWDLPGPGLEPVSSALAGGFLTTAPPGKPSTNILYWGQPKHLAGSTWDQRRMSWSLQPRLMLTFKENTFRQ